VEKSLLKAASSRFASTCSQTLCVGIALSLDVHDRLDIKKKDARMCAFKKILYSMLFILQPYF